MKCLVRISIRKVLAIILAVCDQWLCSFCFLRQNIPLFVSVQILPFRHGPAPGIAALEGPSREPCKLEDIAPSSVHLWPSVLLTPVMQWKSKKKSLWVASWVQKDLKISYSNLYRIPLFLLTDQTQVSYFNNNRQMISFISSVTYLLLKGQLFEERA